MVISRFRQYTQTTWKNVKQVILMQFDDDQLHTFAIIYVDAMQAHAYNMQCSILHIHIRSPTSHTRCGFVCTSNTLHVKKWQTLVSVHASNAIGSLVHYPACVLLNL